jgi:hypothetical protein
LDFNFGNGQVLCVTIDPKFNDRVEFGEDEICVFLGSRPSTQNPNEVLPDEEMCIFKKNLIFLTKRKRVVYDKSLEEKDEWVKLLASMGSNSVN